MTKKISQAEFESHVWYDFQSNTVEFYSNIQKHISAMRKRWGKPDSYNGIGYSWTLPIESFRIPLPKRNITQKQRDASSKNMAKLRGNETK